MGDANYFGTRDHYMFICYTDMIKLIYPVLLKEIVKDYYDDLKEYLNLDHIKHLDMKNLERVCAERIDINPLKYIKKPECPDDVCDLLLKTFKEELIEMYTQSQFSVFGSKMYNILELDRVKEVYIYIEEPCHQVIIDCNVYFSRHKQKIKYLTGDFIEAVKAVPHKPTCYVLNDIQYVHKLIEHQFIDYSEVILGELGCNYELDDNFGIKLKGLDEEIMKNHVFKLGVTPIIEITKDHLSQVDPNEFDNK